MDNLIISSNMKRVHTQALIEEIMTIKAELFKRLVSTKNSKSILSNFLKSVVNKCYL